MQTSEHVNEIFAALALAQGEMPVIHKSKEGKVKGESKSGKAYEYTYKYADIADVLEAVLPVLSKHGLSVIQPTKIENGAIYITTRICHSSGQWFESDYPVASVNGDHQKMGGAMTYARRYALCSTVAIAADEDLDGAGAEEQPKPMRAAPKQQPRPAPAQTNDTPFDDDLSSEARDAFLASAKAIIANTDREYADIVIWWNAEDQKKQRRDFDLSTAQIDELKAMIAARRPAQREAAE